MFVQALLPIGRLGWLRVEELDSLWGLVSCLLAHSSASTAHLHTHMFGHLQPSASFFFFSKKIFPYRERSEEKGSEWV